jgi:hypothetical protein
MNDTASPPNLLSTQDPLAQFEAFFELEHALGQLEIAGTAHLSVAQRQALLIELQSFLKHNRRNPSGSHARKQFQRVKELAKQFDLKLGTQSPAIAI